MAGMRSAVRPVPWGHQQGVTIHQAPKLSASYRRTLASSREMQPGRYFPVELCPAVYASSQARDRPPAGGCPSPEESLLGVQPSLGRSRLPASARLILGLVILCHGTSPLIAGCFEHPWLCALDISGTSPGATATNASSRCQVPSGLAVHPVPPQALGASGVSL